jgi:hypothetical protein
LDLIVGQRPLPVLCGMLHNLRAAGVLHRHAEMSCQVPLGRIIPKNGAFRLFPIDLWTVFGWAIFYPLKLLRWCSLVSFRSALLPWPVARFGMELNNLSPKKVTEVENELTTLSKSVNSTACWKELGADDAELVLGFESWKPSI